MFPILFPHLCRFCTKILKFPQFRTKHIKIVNLYFMELVLIENMQMMTVPEEVQQAFYEEKNLLVLSMSQIGS